MWTLAERCSNSLCGCKSLPGAVVFTPSSFECGAVSLGVPVLCADINFPCDTCFLLGSLCYHRRHSSVGRFPSVFNVSGWTSISRATRALRSLCFPPSSIVCEAHPFGVPFLCADTISILHGCFSSSYTRSVSIPMGVDILVIVQHHRFSLDFVR